MNSIVEKRKSRFAQIEIEKINLKYVASSFVEEILVGSCILPWDQYPPPPPLIFIAIWGDISILGLVGLRLE